MKEPNKHINETLRYDFTDEELTQVARDLGQKCQDKATLEEEKKRTASQYKLRLDTLEGEIEADTIRVNSGYEMRTIECGVFYHDPAEGRKTIVRLDNDKIVRVEPMSEMECQATMDLNDNPETSEPKQLTDDNIIDITEEQKGGESE